MVQIVARTSPIHGKDMLGKYTTDNDTINRMIKTFIKVNQGAHLMVHTIAVSVALHAIEHGQNAPANAFLKAFEVTSKGNNGWRLNTLRSWFETIGPFTWHVDKEKKIAELRVNKEKAKAMREAGMDKALQTVSSVTFWDWKPEAEYKGLDLNAAIIKLVKDANARLKDENPDHRKANKIDTSKLSALAALVNMGRPEDGPVGTPQGNDETKFIDPPKAMAA